MKIVVLIIIKYQKYDFGNSQNFINYEVDVITYF